METKKIETVEVEATYENDGQKVIVDAPKTKSVKEKKPGRVRNWVAGKLHSAGDLLSDDDKIHSLAKKAKKGAVVAGVSALGVVGLAMLGSKGQDLEEGSEDEFDNTNYLEDSETENYADFEEVEDEVTTE